MTTSNWSKVGEGYKKAWPLRDFEIYQQRTNVKSYLKADASFTIKILARQLKLK
ncbi:MAG: hypothetical protein ACRYFA_03585 [Janthinobacterium lividum]